MLCNKIPVVILTVTCTWIPLVVSNEVNSSGEPSSSGREDTLSGSEVNKVLNDGFERERLRLSVDQVDSERPDVVPACLSTDHIYDATAQVCAEPKTQAHCGDNMIFLPVPEDDDLGACACNITNSIECWGRPQVLDDYDQCHGIALQGPCDDGETMVPVDKFNAECGRDACFLMTPKNAVHFSEGSKKMPDDYPAFDFTYKEKCYTTESQAFCRRGQVARFVLPYKTPACVDRNEVNCASRAVGYNLQSASLRDCEPGTVANPDRLICQPESDFDFE